MKINLVTVMLLLTAIVSNMGCQKSGTETNGGSDPNINVSTLDTLVKNVEILQNAIDDYEEFVAIGNSKTDNNEYDAAIAEFNKALEEIKKYVNETQNPRGDIDNGGKSAESGIKLANEKKEIAQKNAAFEKYSQEYRNFVQSGDDKMRNNDLDGASKDFDNALAAINKYVSESGGSNIDIDEGGQEATSMKEEISRRRTDLRTYTLSYNDYVRKGNSQTQSKKYLEARDEYNRAIAEIDKYMDRGPARSRKAIDNDGAAAKNGVTNALKLWEAAQKAAAEAAKQCDCPARNFRTDSDHTYAIFKLPKRKEGTIIEIPGGAYNKYVFPKCNRVIWSHLRFQCDPNSCSWTRVSGSWDADAWCHGDTPKSPYLQVGSK